MAQAPGREVGHAAPRVEDLARERVPHDRVEREVAALRGVLRRHRRIGLHVEIRVLGARAVLAAGHRDVDREVLELRHAEGRADRDDAEFLAQGRLDLARAEAVDLDVDVEDRDPHQRVAHAAADQQRPAAGGTQQLDDPAHGREVAVEADEAGLQVGHVPTLPTHGPEASGFRLRGWS